MVRAQSERLMSDSTSTNIACCPIVELRQYTLRPGARDTLIELFEREFIESQEALGMRIIGTFRDVENADRFVWLRGFDDMDSRAEQLAKFYGGPVWQAHREAANATMIDSDNVLLLRPAGDDAGLELASARPGIGEVAHAEGIVVATIFHVKRPAEFAGRFSENIAPELERKQLPAPAAFVTETRPNTFPRLPVREDARVFVWFSQVADREEYETHFAGIVEKASAEFAEEFTAEPEVLFLAPTSRSLLRGRQR